MSKQPILAGTLYKVRAQGYTCGVCCGIYLRVWIYLCCVAVVNDMICTMSAIGYKWASGARDMRVLCLVLGWVFSFGVCVALLSGPFVVLLMRSALCVLQ